MYEKFIDINTYYLLYIKLSPLALQLWRPFGTPSSFGGGFLAGTTPNFFNSPQFRRKPMAYKFTSIGRTA